MKKKHSKKAKAPAMETILDPEDLPSLPDLPILPKMTRKKNKKKSELKIPTEPTKYEWLQMRALSRKDLSLSAKLVYCCLLLNCSLRNSTFCYQSLKNLTTMTALSRQTISTALKQLAQKDLIKISRCFDPETKANLSNKYELSFDLETTIV
ncbi:MAG: helix-turn-helix domain-containing protein [Clostridia bacterium]|nr:helix-turn-helix domain-containing protein [Clostridia bacterium]